MSALKYILVVIFFCGELHREVYAQAASKNNDSLIEIVDQIAKVNELQGRYVGKDGHESENYLNYLKLSQIASIPQLIDLTSNENGVVASYAGWALIDRKYDGLIDVMAKLLRNDRQVKIFSGCFKYDQSVAHEFYYTYASSLSKEERMADKVLSEMDSLILYSNNPYRLLLSRALGDRIYPDSYRQRIEYWASERHNNDAIEYLRRIKLSKVKNRKKPHKM